MNKNVEIKKIFSIAKKKHQEIKFEEASKLYKEILKIEPNHFETNFYLGTLFIQVGNFKEAVSILKIAIKINPLHVHINNNLGIAFYELGEFDQAIKYYEDALKIDPNYMESVFRLGSLFAQVGDFIKASKMLKQVVDNEPKNPDAHNNLGLTYRELGHFEKSIKCHEKAILIKPNYADYYHNLGLAYKEIGEFKKTILCYVKVIEINPNHLKTINNISILLQKINLNNLNKINNHILKKIFLFLFKRNDIEHNNIFTNAKSVLLVDEENFKLNKLSNLKYLLEEKNIQRLLKKELFLLMLRKTLFKDTLFEKILTKLRKELLFSLFESNKEILKENFDFIIALGEQCFFNEYIFIQSEKEFSYIKKLTKVIEKNSQINELEIAILSNFIPLNSSEIIMNKLSNYKSKNNLFNDLITLQVNNFLVEKKLANTIKSIGQISDIVSQKVKNQYEENPYPRWRYAHNKFPINPIVILNSQIKPNKIKFNNNFNKPNVLIAGCGTGRHIFITQNYLNSNILAVDLSKSSLSYAKRKIEEHGFRNVEFLQSDILQLNSLNKKFDIIESVGVLHHMKEPLKGLEILLNLLEPHGFLKLGLYSKIAREDIIIAREFIQHNRLKSTIDDIRNIRQTIINEKKNKLLRKISLSGDFYSTSSIRDLIFHEQEKQFSLPQISKILTKFNLEFLGFIDLDIKSKYSELYLNDKNNTSLKNWGDFELSHPNTFRGMYKFWVRKKL